MSYEPRAYTFCLVVYQQREDIEQFVTHTKKYAYILHDRDETDPHYHIICSFNGNRSFNSVKKLFHGEGNVFVQVCRDRWASYAYLMHEGEENKQEYGEDEIITNDREYFTGHGEKADIEDFITDLCEEELSLTEMAEKYGKDFMRNYRKYQEFKQAIKAEQRRKKFEEKPCNTKLIIEQEYILSHCKNCPNRKTIACEGAWICMQHESN